MTIDVDKLMNWPIKDREHSYTARDTMLYALGLGFGSDPTDEREIPFVYEEALVAAPTMAVVLGHPGFWLRHPDTGVDWKQILHGEQSLEILRPLAPEGTVVGRTRVTDILDKGADKGAIIYTTRTIADKATGEPIARVAAATFCRADGGFGGNSGPAPKPHDLPQRPPDLTCALPTVAQQALIYRLSGDYNPLHADPKFARAAGFPRPILHGLATYGMAGRAILRTCCDYDAGKLRRLNVRFSAPVFPGETIRFELWRAGPQVSFRASAQERGQTVLNNGYAELAG